MCNIVAGAVALSHFTDMVKNIFNEKGLKITVIDEEKISKRSPFLERLREAV